MRNGLKLFGAFTNVILESRVGVDRVKDFAMKYAVKTGENSKENVITRTDDSAWASSLDTKIYFNAPDWVVDGLKKLGVNVLSGIVHSMKKKYTGKDYESMEKCKYSISNNWLFWWLVDYGYRLGENEAISYNFHLMKEHIRTMDFEPLFNINHRESENAIVEAKMLSA